MFRRPQQGGRAVVAVSAQAVSVVDQHDAVVHHHTYQKHAADHAEHIHINSSNIMDPDRADARQWDCEYD